ncbi:MAG TPA: YCF48-related protein, partial [Flavisolibacter sp.]|nr:YCF48-related protein [Flavisolibacter sp.]
VFLLSHVAFSQTSLPHLDTLTSGTQTSLRGLSVVNDNILWVSGTNGTVGKSTNGGKDWKWFQVKAFEKADFRDIEAFDATTAVIISVGEPGYILRTVDGGENWKVVYENKTPGIFLDALDFWNINAGIVIGDPIDGKIFIARTFDGGMSWKAIPDRYRPTAEKGEALFAASGTAITALDRDEAVFVTGGKSSHAYIRDQKIKLPLIQGKESTGAFSVAVWDHNKLKGGNQLVVVGGDYAADSISTNNCFYSNDRGQTWKAPTQPPHGYKSCVDYVTEKELIACGTSGVDFSTDGGDAWAQISRESYHVCQKAKDGKAVYLAGNNGRVAKLVR